MVLELCSGGGLIVAWRVSIAENIVVLKHAKTFIGDCGVTGGCGHEGGARTSRGQEKKQGSAQPRALRALRFPDKEFKGVRTCTFY